MSNLAWTEWAFGDSERKRINLLDRTWVKDGLCTKENIPTKVFYPEKKRGDVAAAAARKICFACSVRLRCADWAIQANEEYGVFGATSPRQRQKMKSAGIIDVLEIMPKEKKRQENLTSGE